MTRKIWIACCCIALLTRPISALAAEEHDHAKHEHEHEGHKHEQHEHEQHQHDQHEHEHDDHADEIKLSAEAVRSNGIVVEPVKRQVLKATFQVPARIALNAEKMAHISSSVQGRVVKIDARVGQTVKKGDPLVTVESPELAEAQSDYAQKKTAVSVAKLTVNPAKNAFERAKSLYEQNNGISLNELQRRELEFATAQGALQSAQAALVAAKHKLQLLGVSEAAADEMAAKGQIDPTYTIFAPIDGQVIEREVTLGELVTPEKEALLVLADTSRLWVLADVPEGKVSQVHMGTTARVQTGFMNEPVEGKVTHVAAQLNPSARSVRVRIEFENAQASLRAGMFARVELVTSAGKESAAVLAVPDAAIQVVEGKPSVFVPAKGEPDTFVPKAVEVGASVGGMVPVLSGISEGELIVTRNTFLLKAELGKSGAAHEH